MCTQAKGSSMEPLSKEKLLQLNQVLLGIHSDDAEHLFSNAVERLKDLIVFKYSMTSFSSNFDRKIDSFNYESADMDEKDIREYVQYYEKMDFCVWYNSQPLRAVYRSSDMITKQGLEDSVIYQEWMRPLGIYYSLFATCFANGINYGVVSFMRSYESGDFTDEEVQLLSIVNDHLSQRLAQLYPSGIGRVAFDASLNSFRATYRLTTREFEIIQCLRRGMERHEIAERFSISNNTLKKHLSNIYKKLGVNNEAKFFAVVSEYLDYEGTTSSR